MILSKTINVDVNINVTAKEVLESLHSAGPLEMVGVLLAIGKSNITDKEIALLYGVVGPEAVRKATAELSEFVERLRAGDSVEESQQQLLDRRRINTSINPN